VALHDEILREIISGRVPFHFKTCDLMKRPAVKPKRYRVGSVEYSENTIKTVPRNHSVRPDGSWPGDYVRKGRRAAFYWFGNGEFELTLDRRHELDLHEEPYEEDITNAEGDEESLFAADQNKNSESLFIPDIDESLVKRIFDSGTRDPAELIVDYVAQKPFQSFRRKKPIGSKRIGWGQRLEGYFWPTPDQDWNSSTPQLERLSFRFRGAIAKLETRSNDEDAIKELHDAFKHICVWGGVKLPESDARIVASEVLCAYKALLGDQIPTANCRLNSAWTKLYAFALPDKCVIYDSRVAAALTSILDPVMPELSGAPQWKPYKSLGTIPGRGGSRPRSLRWSWPSGYRSWQAQQATNRLCRRMVDVLERKCSLGYAKPDGTYRWHPREVEAVLFMEGY
jgi:hypothetical protein